MDKEPSDKKPSPHAQYRHEFFGLTRERRGAEACRGCVPLERAARTIGATALALDIAEKKGASTDLERIAVCLTTVIERVREGLEECPGRQEDGNCGQSPEAQQRAFYEIPVPEIADDTFLA